MPQSPAPVIHSDPEILGGTPVFVGTRVPFQALIDYLEGGHPLAEFLDDFPSVTRDQAVAALDLARDAVLARVAAAQAPAAVRVLLDECLPAGLRRDLPGHDVTTVQRMGWAGTRNGALLPLVAGAGFAAFVTIDRGIEFQQRVAALPFGVVALRAPSNDIADLRPLMPAVLAALPALAPGHLVRVPRAAVQRDAEAQGRSMEAGTPQRLQPASGLASRSPAAQPQPRFGARRAAS